jgi:hypothetical protein
MLTVQRFVENNNNSDSVTSVIDMLSDFIAVRPLYYVGSVDGGSMFV